MRSTKVFCGPMLRLAHENYSVVLTVFSLGNKIFLVEEKKRTCFRLKVGLNTEAASFSCCLASFVSSFAPNDMLRHVENKNDASKTVKSLRRRLLEMCSKSAHGCFGRPKV